MSDRRLKNVDAADRLYRLKALSWAIGVGIVGGGGAGMAIAIMLGWNLLLGAFIGIVVTVPWIYFLAVWAMEGAGAVAHTIYSPSGSSTPRKREYSYAESLVARARYDDAAATYELYCTEYPEDPEPYFRLARLLRDHLNAYEDAIAWFRRARADADLVGAQELVAIQEIIDIYSNQLGTPRKAIPELALLCERFPGTPAADAARRELTEIRELMARELEGLEPLTAQSLLKTDRASTPEAVAERRDELEERLIRDALRENGGDRRGAALRLGVTVDVLEEKIRELGI